LSVMAPGFPGRAVRNVPEATGRIGTSGEEGILG